MSFIDCIAGGVPGRNRRLVLRGPVIVACLLAGLIVVAAPAAAPIGTVSNYTDPSISNPLAIAAGPDGALWFTNAPHSSTGQSSSIGRITTNGAVSNYTDPSVSFPDGITAGPDGALWFTNFRNGSIGRITTSGTVSNYTDPTITVPSGITAGPDGALWFANGNGSIGRITTSGSVNDYTDPTIAGPYGITAGPDGALWFTNVLSNSIGRIQALAPTLPTTIGQCQNGGWKSFGGVFKNEGDCVSFVATNGKNGPG